MEPTRRRRAWRDKFREAARGVKLGVRGHSSFSVHFFFAALALTAAVALFVRVGPARVGFLPTPGGGGVAMVGLR